MPLSHQIGLSKNKAKYIKSLHHKKFRDELSVYLVEGVKMAEEIILEHPELVEEIFALPSWLSGRHPLPGNVVEVTEAELKSVSALTTPNQVMVVARKNGHTALPDPLPDISLYLDGIQDPGNLGTILRIADWFSIRCVFLSADCADVYNPKVVQSSMGAIWRVITFRTGLAAIGNRPAVVYGAAMQGDPLFDCNPEFPCMLVVGGEGQGITPETDQCITHRLHIPSGTGSKAESLNAAVACGIMAAHFSNKLKSIDK